MYDVSIKKIDDIILAGLPHKGPYTEIGDAFEKAAHSGIKQGFIKDIPTMIGVFYDNPDFVASENLRSFAGILIDSHQKLKTPLKKLKIVNGLYATLKHRGPYDKLSKAYFWLYNDWSKQSGYQFTDLPAFEKYLNTPHETAYENLLTEIYAPLKDTS